MSQTGNSARVDVWCVQGLIAVALSELVLREAYHRVGFQTDKFVLLALAWIVACGLLLCARRAAEGRATLLLRLAFLVSAGCAAYLFINVSWLQKLKLSVGSGTVFAVGATAALAVAAWTLRIPPSSWPRIRRTVMTGAILFWCSQVVLVWLFAPRLEWPPRPLSGEARRDGITVFLLLDEMNAKLAPAFVDTLREEGLEVAQRRMKAVGPNTLNVVPQMFSGLPFDMAKACWTTAICSSGNVLDFARITASRNDIDVVGFYHPYCAMKGLRSCSSLELSVLQMLDPQRWRCAVADRLRLGGLWRGMDCGPAQLRGWDGLVSRMLESLWAIPVWTQGGLLFAHLPLPHPPGSTPQATLQRHYLDNAERARAVVREMARRARASGREFHFVIFSDHPLRQSQWCRNRLYAGSGCADNPQFEDDAVPLIVAGSHLPDLSKYDSNGFIFDLQRDWP